MNITTQLAGRKVREVWRNGNSLVIRCDDGYEMQVGWAHPDTGQPVNGVPVILRAGKHVITPAQSFRRPGALIEIPHRTEVGL